MKKRGMITACQKNEACWMNINSLDFVREQGSRGFLAIQRLGLFKWNVAKKNGLRLLRKSVPHLLRFKNKVGQRFIMWWSSDLFGVGIMASYLSQVQKGETGKIRMASRHPLLHKEICAGGWAQMPNNDSKRCRQRGKVELENSQGIGQAIYAGTIEASRKGATGSDWHRRDINTKRSQIPDYSQRSCSEAANLVWRGRSLGSKHGYVLWVVRRKEKRQNQISGDGYVEGLRELSQEERAASGDTIRQVSRDETFRGRARRDKEARIRATFRQGSQIYQGTKVGFVIKSGESDARRKNVAKSIIESQQTFADGLFTQGNLWPTVGLPNGRLGATVLRKLESSLKVAETQALRKFCKTDRKTLGRNSGLQQIRKQGAAGVCGRIQQQNTSDSTQVLWFKRRRVFKTKNLNLYVGGSLN